MMRKQGRIIAMLSVAALTVATARMAQHLWSTQRRVHAAVAGTRPNIIMILADDLGYADISAYKIDRFHTPNIDREAADLAAEQGSTIQALTAEALNMLFAKYGKPTVATP
jgi:hypothetical protein